jgi:1-acyl-sn-glycerol-3-phosphate acyltransferase
VVLWKFYFFFLFIVILLLFYPFFRVLLNDRKNFPTVLKLMRIWGGSLHRLGGVYIQHLVKPIFPDPPYIVCPNHSSYLDIVLMYTLIPDYFIFMGKDEIKDWPLFHILFTKGMNILVERSSRTASHKAFLKAGEELDRGSVVIIFPEGTIPPNAPTMKIFKNGAFKLAMEKNVPIVPISFRTNWKLLQSGAILKSRGRPGLSKVYVHKAILPKENSDEEFSRLRQTTFDTINSQLERHED